MDGNTYMSGIKHTEADWRFAPGKDIHMRKVAERIQG